eukprot:5707907-Ditylum_brightwellii.AAC.1
MTMYIRENAFSAKNANSQASVVPDWPSPNYRLLAQEQGKGRTMGNMLIGYPKLSKILRNGKDSEEASLQI